MSWFEDAYDTARDATARVTGGNQNISNGFDFMRDSTRAMYDPQYQAQLAQGGIDFLKDPTAGLRSGPFSNIFGGGGGSREPSDAELIAARRQYGSPLRQTTVDGVTYTNTNQAANNSFQGLATGNPKDHMWYRARASETAEWSARVNAFNEAIKDPDMDPATTKDLKDLLWGGADSTVIAAKYAAAKEGKGMYAVRRTMFAEQEAKLDRPGRSQLISQGYNSVFGGSLSGTRGSAVYNGRKF